MLDLKVGDLILTDPEEEDFATVLEFIEPAEVQENDFNHNCEGCEGMVSLLWMDGEVSDRECVCCQVFGVLERA